MEVHPCTEEGCCPVSEHGVGHLEAAACSLLRSGIPGLPGAGSCPAESGLLYGSLLPRLLAWQLLGLLSRQDTSIPAYLLPPVWAPLVFSINQVLGSSQRSQGALYTQGCLLFPAEATLRWRVLPSAGKKRIAALFAEPPQLRRSLLPRRVVQRMSLPELILVRVKGRSAGCGGR